MPSTPRAKAAILADALPYIREFAGSTVVIKYGGHAMQEPGLAELFAQDVVLMRLVGINPVIVHGGGPQISDLMRRLGKEPEFVDGLRVTDAETIDIVRMALVGKVNRDIVTSLNRHGSYAVGLSGEDASLITVEQRAARLGFVGDVRRIEPAVLNASSTKSFIPVVATVGVDEKGQPHNVNADAAAGAIAQTLTAEKLVYLTDVHGIYRDIDDTDSIVSRVDVAGLTALLETGHVGEGNTPEGPLLHRRRPRRRPTGPHPRRPPTPRAAPRVLHPRGHRHDGAPMTATTLSYDQLAALDAEHVMPTYARLPVAFVRGEGTVLFDTEGRRYLDFLGGIAVTALGHAHPAIADALADQARTLVHVSNLYLNDVQPRLAARLDRLLGGGGRVFFSNSGAEANECAIKLARRHGQRHGGPERYHVLAAYGSFHGRTLASLAATGQPHKHEPFQPLPPGFRHVEFGDVDPLARALDERVCAVLLEPIQGEGGVQPAPPGYLAAIRQLCDDHEALLIVDEVQTGLGRTGRWFGFQHAPDVQPDVVTLARPSATACPSGPAGPTAPRGRHSDRGTTAARSAGSPSLAWAALAVLDVMEAEDVPARAARAGNRLTAALTAAARRRHRARRRAAPRRRARPRADLRRRGRGLPRTRPRRQRRHPDRPAPRPLAPRHRRRAHRGGGDPPRRPRPSAGLVTRPNDFLEVDGLDPATLAALLERAETWKHAPERIPALLAGQGVAMFFEKPSARTRASTEMAAATLGAHPIYLREEEVGMGTRETVEDVARTLAGYCTILCARVHDHATLEAMAAAVDVPVVNLLSDRAHPCQALADLVTLRELFGGLDGRRVAYIGDGNNVAASLAFAAALCGLELTVASPPGYTLEDDSWTAPATSAGPSNSSRTPTRPYATRTPSTPTSGRPWAKKPSGTAAACRVRRLHRRRATPGRRPPRRPLPALPARPPGRRGHRRGDRRTPSRRSGSRPRTGCTPPGRCSLELQEDECPPSANLNVSTASPACSRSSPSPARARSSSSSPWTGWSPPKRRSAVTSRSSARSRCGSRAAPWPTRSPSTPKRPPPPTTICAVSWATSWSRSPTAPTSWCSAPHPAPPTSSAPRSIGPASPTCSAPSPATTPCSSSAPSRPAAPRSPPSSRRSPACDPMTPSR